jgi:phosphatidate cytidylyltransferase
VYGFIAFSSAVCYLHPRLRRPESRAIRQAVTSWWAPALVAGLVVLGGTAVAVAVFALVSGWSLREYLRMLPAADRSRKLDALAYAAIPLHYAALVSGREPLFFSVVLLWTFGILPLAAAVLREPTVVLRTVPQLQFGVVLTVVALSHVARLFFLPPLVPAGPAGLASVLLLCVMIGDSTQYFFGKLLGRHALAPVLSPKKTWEGLLGGTLAASAVGFFAAPLLTPLRPPAGALVGGALCLGGLAGDLLISAVKRGAGVKDTGVVLPGQGGVLDRCDSLLLTAPLYYYGMAAWLW